MPLPNQIPSLLQQPSNGNLNVTTNQPAQPVPGGLFSSNVETGLAVPLLLLGALASGTPGGAGIGNLLQVGGGLLGEHAKHRRDAQDVSSMLPQLQSLDKNSTPGAWSYAQKLLPNLNNMSPELAMRNIQSVLGMAQSELNKSQATSTYYNQKTQQFEKHSAAEFQNGQIPSNLLPAGGLADAVWKQQHGIGDKKSDQQQTWDTIAQANFGMDFPTLQKNNPKAALQVIAAGKKLSADITNQDSFNREVQLLKLRQADERSLMGERAALDIRKSATETELKANIGMKMAREKFLNTPIGSSKYFAVDPRTFGVSGEIGDSLADVKKKGLGLVRESDRSNWEQSTAALADLDSLESAGMAVLPKTGTTVTTDPYIRLKATYDTGAYNYRSAKLNLIAAMRAMTGTGRVNQKELAVAIDQLDNAGNAGQLQAAVRMAKRAISNNLSARMMVGARSASADLSDATSAGMRAGMSGGADTSTTDPGVSVSW